MKNFIFSCIVGIIFMGTGFLFGYMFSGIYAKNHTNPSAQSSLPREINDEQPHITSVPTPYPSVEPEPTVQTINTSSETYYLIEGLDDSLCIYEIDSDEKALIKSFGVNLDILPTNDKNLLEQGIKTFSLSDAYRIAENFTS